MADLVFNVAKGRGVQLAKNVEDNDPAAAVLRVFAIVSTDTDDDLKDADTMAAVLALSSTAEATNSGYANISCDETQITITLDDTNNLHDAILADQTFTSIVAGDDWTDIIVAYDPDGTDTDSGTIPLSLHDFVVSPNGGNIVADFPATGFFRAS